MWWGVSCIAGVGHVGVVCVITHRLSKIYKWIQGDVYEQGQSFLSHDK